VAEGLSTSPNKETVTMRLPSGEEIDAIIPAGLSDDQAKSLMRMKRPDLFGAPAGMPKPPNPLADAAAKAPAGIGYDRLGPIPDTLVTRIGRRIEQNFNPKQIPAAADAITAGLKNIKEGGPSQLPAFLEALKQYKKPENVIGDAASAYLASGAPELPRISGASPPPWWKSTAETPKPAVPYQTSVAMSVAKHLPFLGKYARGADLLQKVYGKLTAEPPAPLPAPRGPTGPPEMWGQRIPDLRPAPPVSKTAINQTLDRSLTQAVGNKPIQPGVPLRNQGASSAVKSFRYDPAAQELHVTTHEGTTYISGEVTPDQAQAFRSAPSKGKAWQAIRENSPLVGKIPSGGKRIAMKGAQKFKSASPTDEPAANDLVDALRQSLQQVKRK
jgi:hypothetical protein